MQSVPNFRPLCRLVTLIEESNSAYEVNERSFVRGTTARTITNRQTYCPSSRTMSGNLPVGFAIGRMRDNGGHEIQDAEC